MGGITIEREMKERRRLHLTPSVEDQVRYMIQEKFGGDFETSFFLLAAAGDQARKDSEKEIYSIEIANRKSGFPDTITRLKFNPFEKSVTAEVLMLGPSGERILSTNSISYVRKISSFPAGDGHTFIIENGSNEIRLDRVSGTVAHR